MHTQIHSKEVNLCPPICLPTAVHCPTTYFYPTFSRSSARSSRFSSALRSSADTPLASYVTHRHRFREVIQPSSHERHILQVPLSAISPPKAQLGAVGGSFNSTTKVKCVPLPYIYNPHLVNRRGIRSVGLHSARYLPCVERTRTISDSLLNLPLLSNGPQTRLLRQEERLQESRLSRELREMLTHRMDQPYYMGGQSAHIFKKRDYILDEFNKMKTVRYAENPTLYYGRALGSPQCLQTRAVQRFEAQLKSALKRGRSYSLDPDIELDGVGFGHISRPSRVVSPTSTDLEDSQQNDNLPDRRTEQIFVTQ